MKKCVSQMVFCLMECAKEPCCRSVNYKKTPNLQNELNCEMLHNVIYNISDDVLEKNNSYDYAYLTEPQKDYNLSCFAPVLENSITQGQDPDEYGLTSCNTTTLVKKGCYADPGAFKTAERTFPLLQIYPKEVDWYDGWDEYLHNVTCYCANLARNEGYRYFGVQNFKECWFGEPSNSFFTIHSKVEKCWGVRPNYKECSDKAITKCVGSAKYNYIYHISSN
ncbi:uncharacterized protein LOC114524587 [Dendronephthya gigantea]|uniref:uncharacterized protein LOC114524587 n=1 Tax=Dendronephthya gigantea TaxID=151771 RepID=UPI00106AD340|nr:uncharacterized protein LOC114524587 [Dendronephthya gigantea]